MERITMKHLDVMASRLNRITGSPSEPYLRDGNKFTPQAGCYHLSQAYGGVMLVRMSMTPGCTGVSTPLMGGHVTKREAYNQIYAFMRGIESQQDSVYAMECKAVSARG